MSSDGQRRRAWLFGLLLFGVGAIAGLALWVLLPWPWPFIGALAIAGFFLFMGRRGISWVVRYKLNQRKGERDH